MSTTLSLRGAVPDAGVDRTAATALTVLAVGPPPSGGVTGQLARHGVEWRTAGADCSSAELVFAALPPFGAARRASARARRHGLPLVLELTTPWALDGRRVFATPLHRAAALRAMRRTLAAAAAVVVETPELAAACTGIGIPADRMLVVPAGVPDAAELPPGPDDAFHLWVATPFAPAVDPPCPTQDGLLQRRSRQIEPVGATSFYLFSALAALRSKRPELFRRLRVQLAVPLDRSNREIAEWLQVESALVPATGVPAAADAVFVCQHGEVGEARTLTFADGLFAALATGRPLLAAVPAGAGRDLVTGLGAGIALPPTDAPPLCLALERLIEERQRGALRPGACRTALAPIARSALAARLATALMDLARRGAGRNGRR